MKIISRLQQGGYIAKQDNTRISRPIIHQPVKVIPKQPQLIDLGGTPSKDTRTVSQRNEDYWKPIKGVKDRFKSSMENKTNPLVGIENAILPSLAGAALVTTPATVIGGVIGGEVVNKMTGGWGQWLEDKTGLPKELGEYLNPGTVYGGLKGYKADSGKLISKFIKGDADLGWSTLGKSHWIFDKNARNSTNVSMAVANRVLPFLSNIEKTPARIAAYRVGRRTKGNASVSLKDIKSNDSTYTGAATPDGNNGRDLLGLYLFKNDPLINRSPWFKKVMESFTPSSGKGFNYSKRYSELYPNIENSRYKMQSVVKDSHPLNFRNIDEFNEYSSGIGKLQGKEGDMVIDLGNGYQTFKQPGTNFVGPIDDVGGHMIRIDYNNKGTLTQVTQDMWKFNPRDYSKRWSGSNIADAVRANKQAALMDKVGTPFILQQENPIRINTKRVWKDIQNIPNYFLSRRLPTMQGNLLTLSKGGSFRFSESNLVKNSRYLSGRRDMRKKLVKSDRPTYTTNRVKKGLDGLKFVSYDTVESPGLDVTTLKLSTNVFSSYNIPVPTKKTNENSKEVIKEERIPPIVNPPTNIKFTGSKNFISKMKPIFESALAQKGLNPKYADYLVAQSALESGWGKHQSGKFNLGGIKGKGSVRRTREVIDGKDTYINDSFRDFNSLEDYANYHVGLLNNKRYNAFNSGDFIDRVVKGGYATDPSYRSILTKMYQRVINA